MPGQPLFHSQEDDQEFEGSCADVKGFAEAQLEHYASGTRYHIRIWRTDPVFSSWAPCDDQDFREC